MMPKARYENYELELKPGDAVFVYTDGVPEASNAENKFYTLTRLEGALNTVAEQDPAAVLKAVRADVEEFVGDAEQFDDLTMLCLLYMGGNHEETDCQSGEADRRDLSEK